MLQTTTDDRRNTVALARPLLRSAKKDYHAHFCETKSATGLSVVDVGGAEVDDNVRDKHDVDEYVYDEQRVNSLVGGVVWS